ncbi:MAG: hypothetical protein IID40_03480, partial [Planctomycetes bacterium]|nr:hypothetical protein [Planctomycetota bacterium]
MRRRHTMVFGWSVAIATVVVLPSAALGQWVVNSPADIWDWNVGDGLCEVIGPGTGLCTLRAAIQEANAQPGPNTIVVPVTVLLTLAGAGENAALFGDLDITDDLTITGFGSTQIIGGGLDRVFHIVSSGITVSISGLIITGGSVSGEGGAGIWNRGTLYLDNVWLHLNQVTGSSSSDVGGGLLNSQGTVTMTNCWVFGNSAQRGGGLFNAGGSMLTVSKTLFLTNLARTAGGGVTNYGTLTLTNTTLSGNTADGSGGGIRT